MASAPIKAHAGRIILFIINNWFSIKQLQYKQGILISGYYLFRWFWPKTDKKLADLTSVQARSIWLISLTPFCASLFNHFKHYEYDACFYFHRDVLQHFFLASVQIEYQKIRQPEGGGDKVFNSHECITFTLYLKKRSSDSLLLFV